MIALDAAGSRVSIELATVIIGGVVTVLGVLIPGIVTIIKALRQNQALARQVRDVSVAHAVADKVRGKVHDTQLQEIHLLTNGRLVTALRALALITKREAERTKDPTDLVVAEQAQADLIRAEAASVVVERIQGTVPVSSAQADAAEAQLTALIETVVQKKMRRATDWAEGEHEPVDKAG